MSYNPFSLAGKTVLVTGASSGIGKATAIECSKLGAKVIVTGRNIVRLNETFMLLEGKNNLQFVADLSNNNELAALVDFCPPLDGCVNSAGIPMLNTVKFIKRDEIVEILGVNAIAPILLTSLLIKNRKINKESSIVFVSSISGVYISALGESLYSTTKGAINGFVKGAAIELASQKIRVNCVNPGLIQTNLLDLAGDVFSKEQVDDKIKQYPLKRIGKPEDVAFAVVYLLSDASGWVTGINLLIDGGFTLQ